MLLQAIRSRTSGFGSRASFSNSSSDSVRRDATIARTRQSSSRESSTRIALGTVSLRITQVRMPG
jgi:hypothetical protein